jgi:hypothetical protein
LSPQPDNTSPLRAALQPAALRAALVPTRPVFADPWESEADMFAVYLAVSVIEPLLLWAGGKAMGSLFGFSSHWSRGVFIAAAVVGAGGFMTIVGRERTRLSVDILTITAWLVLGVVVAPVIGLAPPKGVAFACYGVLLAGIFLYVTLFGHWRTGFIRTLSWPVTWSALAAFFAYCVYRLIIYQ